MAVTLSQFVQYVKTLDLTPTDVMPQDGWIIYGDGNVLKRVNSNTIISSIIQASFEVIDQTTVIPATGYRRYRVLDPGTYAGITVTQEEINNNWVYIVVDEGVSSKELEPKPDFGSTIKNWVSTEDGLTFPDVRQYGNKVFRVIEGQTANGADIPGVSAKWLLLIEDTVSMLFNVNINTANIGDLSFLETTNSNSLVEAINEVLGMSNGSLYLENLIDVDIPTPTIDDVLTFNGTDWIASPDLDIRIGEIEGLGLFANQTAQEISIKNASGVTLSTISVAFLNNEGTTFIYNATTEKLELQNDLGTILAEIPVSAFVSNLAKTISLGGNKLDLKDTAGNILSFVNFGIENIDGLQAAINVKVDKVPGKALSTNDYTTTEKNKLAGIEAGAEVNLIDGATQTYVNNQDAATLQAAKDFATAADNDLSLQIDATEEDILALESGKEPLNVPPIADNKVAVYNLDGTKRYEDYGGGSSGSSLLSKSFTYTSGAQTFTADFDIVQVSSLVVGNSFLQEGTQYTVSGAVVTITDTLTSGAVIQLKYWKANAVNATNYTKAESDLVYAQKSNITHITIEEFGAVGDGVTDDSQALIDALQFLKITGGKIMFKAKTYLIAQQILMPDSEAVDLPTLASIIFEGVGANHTGRGGEPVGGTILDMTYSGTYGKLVTLGLGYFEICRLTFRDNSASSTPFIYNTYTTMHIHDCGFYGSKNGSLADQDAIIMGGTQQIEGPRGYDVGFQGYGTIIKDNYFSRIRRMIYGRVFFNANIIQNNTVWSTCGTNLFDGACIELDGDPASTGGQVNAGNVISGNLIEMPNYVYGIKLTKSEKNTFLANNFYDENSTTISFYNFNVNAGYNYILAGFHNDTTAFINASSLPQNTIINTHQSQESSYSEPQVFREGVIIKRKSGSSKGPVIEKLTGELYYKTLISEGRIVTIVSDSFGTTKQIEELRDFGGGVITHSIKGTDSRIESSGKLRVRSGGAFSELYLGDTTRTNVYIIDGKLYTNRYGAANEIQGISANPTANRPTGVGIGYMYYDTTLQKPIWWAGADWKDATGVVV